MSDEPEAADNPAAAPSPIKHSITRRVAKDKKVGLFSELRAPTRDKTTSRASSPADEQLPETSTRRELSAARQIPEPRASATGNASSLSWDSHLSPPSFIDPDSTLTGAVIDGTQQFKDNLPFGRSITGVLKHKNLVLSQEQEALLTSDEEVFAVPTKQPQKSRNKKSAKRLQSAELDRTLIDTATDSSETGSPPKTIRLTPPTSADSSVVTVRAVTPQTLKMTDVQQYKVDVEKAKDYVQDELPEIEMDMMPLSELKAILATASELKNQLADAMAHLATLDSVAYAATTKEHAVTAKKALIKFLKEGYAYVKNLEDEHRDPRAEILLASTNIKTARVQKVLSSFKHTADLLSAQLQSINDADTSTDNALFALLENYTAVCKDVDEFLKDLQGLYNDACSAGMGQEAEEIDEISLSLKTQRISTNKAVLKLKQRHGVDGRGSSNRTRLKDIKPPIFSGTSGGSNLDYYSFKTEYLEYVKCMNFSREEEFDMLRKTCLQGAAQAIIFHFKTSEQIWIKLRSSYGDSNLLINSKIKEMEKLGKCPEPSDKRRDWFIEVHSKISRLKEMALEHGLAEDVYHSNVMGAVRNSLPDKLKEKLREHSRETEINSGASNSREDLYDILIRFLQNRIEAETFNMKFDQQLSMQTDNTSGHQRPRPAAGEPAGAKPMNKNKKIFAAQQTSGGNSSKSNRGSSTDSNNRSGPPAAAGNQRTRPAFQPQALCQPKGIHCSICKEDHEFLFECRNFQAKPHKERLSLARYLKTCFRCLRMDSRVYKYDMDTWYADHKKNCLTDYQCEQGNCKTDPSRDSWRKRHIIMCEYHSEDNKQQLQRFITTIGANKTLQNLKFFFHEQYNLVYSGDQENEVIVTEEGITILPDVMNPSIYMCQTVPGTSGLPMLVFFDSGCSSASISSRAYRMLDCIEARPGPTFLNIAGGNTIKIPYGDERFTLELTEDAATRATISALRMDQVTSRFPYWPLQAAWDLLALNYTKDCPDGPPLPGIDEGIGGVEVDIMLGIRYNQYFPTLLYILPSGLAIYEAKFKTVSGNLGILGGTHESWVKAVEKAHFMGPTAYFTSEVKAHQTMQRCLTFVGEFDDIHTSTESFLWDSQNHGIFFSCENFSNSTKLSGNHPNTCSMILEDIKPESDLQEAGQVTSRNPSEAVQNAYFGQTMYSNSGVCTHEHCSKHTQDDDWMYKDNWDLAEAAFNVLQDEKRFETSETVSTEITYRCVTCRNCLKCKDSENHEKISLNEEVEQALLERSLRLEADNRRVWASLPFIKDPSINLNPNRYLAEKIFNRQLSAIEKNPEMRADILKSHAKLEDRGFVIKWDEIPEDYKERLETIKGPGYIIPWQVVYKASSISTPVRMVMNGSCCTPGGDSLNNILAKGANTLTKIFDILVSFRSKLCALSCDIKMAYNNVWLEPEFYKFQQYLWKEGLDPTNPTIIMVIITIIYGIKPSGQQTIAAFRLLADYCIEHYPQHTAGALAIKMKAYMDDVAASTNSPAESITMAESIAFTLDLASMAVKAFAHSGSAPPEEMSADGIHVGLLGYLWDPLMDVIRLDIKPITFDKPKKGKIPPPVSGDFSNILQKNLTKRTLVSQCAKIFDPLGLVTPITAKLKLDLHQISDLKVKWDELLPVKFLQVWMDNLRLAQKLSDFSYPRTLVPTDAANTDLEYLVSSDASIDIAIASVHGRILRTNGLYSCTLLAAKSKLVRGCSVPRAELKAAVVAATLYHIVKKNTLDQFKSTMFFSDSAIILYWISQDYRPLQIAVRNAVIEIRRLTFPEQWFHVDGEHNIADLGTRPASIEEISPTSDWFLGKPWMRLPKDQFKVKPITQLTLENKEKVEAAKEMKAPDLSGLLLDAGHDKVGQRYSYSKYPIDPCHTRWPVSVGVLAFILRIADIAKRRPTSKSRRPTQDERTRAELIFFQIATKEVKHFSKEKDWKPYTIMKDKVLYRTDRVLQGQKYDDMENVFVDVEPLMFVKPVIDRYSPLAYSIMLHSHGIGAHHQNAAATIRNSLEIAHIIGGRDLANEIRDKCAFCRRYKRKLLQVELGQVHRNRLTVAPAFTICQVDILGPLQAACEHNYHRSTVEIYGLVFKCTATCAVAVHVMGDYSASSVLMAYTRFASRYGHPSLLYIDQGSQLVKAAKEMERNIMDLTDPISTRFEVGIEYHTGPVGAHHVQGQVERSIKEVKKLFYKTYKGMRLDILSYETAFSWVSNELNCMPLFLGSKYRNLDHLDLITPARLLLGRNNRRSLSGCTTLDVPSRAMQQMDLVYNAWWKVWETEKLQDFVPRSAQWPTTTYQPVLGDIVIFQKTPGELKKGQPIWRTGRITKLEPCTDHLARKVIIEYKNMMEDTFRTTRRSVRDIAVLHAEGESTLADMLNKASKESTIIFYLDQKRRVTQLQNPEPWGWSLESILPPTAAACGPVNCSDTEGVEI